MGYLVDRIRTRLLPAMVTALGVAFLTAGLLSYVDQAQAEPAPTDSGAPSESPTPSASSLVSLPPLPTPTASGEVADRVATRVVVPALHIDLPVILPPGGPNDFPPCNVAMYIQELHQPGEPGATYLYAHARTGMFLPILEQSRIDNGKRMVGMLVQVFTSDDMLFLYEVTEVRRHVVSLDKAFATKEETLWLQTSETARGPEGVVQPKVQLVARPLSSGPADHAEAHPKAKPIFCG